MATAKEILKQYPATKTGKEYVKKWNELVVQLVLRDNFKPIHLHTLEILCSLYEENEMLSTIIEMQGVSYETLEARMGGIVYKIRPEVAQLNKCRGQIASFTKMLGLTLTKDNSPSSTQKGNDEWA